MSNPYAPPQATVADVVDPRLGHVAAERGTRLAAAILDGIIAGAMIYSPFFIGAVIGGVAGGAQPPPLRVGGGSAAPPGGRAPRPRFRGWGVGVVASGRRGGIAEK